MGSQLQAIDDLDTRREVMVLLGLLTAAERTEFMQVVVATINAAIQQTQVPPWNLVSYWTETGEINEVYAELFIVVSQYRLPVKVVLEDLEKFVSARGKKLWKGT